jgi:hypothetical protein
VDGCPNFTVYAPHQQAQRYGVGFPGRHFATDLPARHHQDAVGQGQNLFQLHRHQQDGLAGIAQFHQPAVDELDGTDIHPACGLANQQQVRIGVDFARQHHFC